MPASMIVGRGEAKAMATKQKACRVITKKELAYHLSRFRTVDATTMRVSILMLVEELKKTHIDFFPSKGVTWDHWKMQKALMYS